MANRLASESSPYLRQHAGNPVDWYAWGSEAIERAKAEDKPILLSIGYSACHWCHVMEHESFENAEIAALMNEQFVNIKVDREERPDLDQIYQNVAQLMTRSGGWPLTVFLTPDLKPFFGGTYFPPEDRYGRPGLPKVLQALAQAFRTDRASVNENARRLTEALSQIETGPADLGNKRPDIAALRTAADVMLRSVDWRHGGFGDAPKFPHTMNLEFLWRLGEATEFGMAQDFVILSLSKMARGGIYDQLGGGFHRYSVDNQWLVPHFEKMLYDNALLLKLYAGVLLTPKVDLKPTERALFTNVLADTTRYVLREMLAPEGAFFSTQDADSEGVEGKFFVWTPKALRTCLTEDEAKAFELRFGVTETGNFENSGDSVLSLVRSIEDVAAQTGKSSEETATLLESAQVKLFEARAKRVHPARDEKILTAWNGLMISGLTWAARALRTQSHGPLAEEALETSIRAMSFVRTTLSQGENRLWSVYKDGKPKLNAYLDDYAFCAMGALDLARVLEDEGEVDILVKQARAWLKVIRTRFADPKGVGLFFTSDDHEKLIQRPKALFDQAIPAGNNIALECMLALAELCGDSELGREAEEYLYRLFPLLEKTPMGMGELANAALLAVAGPVTVAGRGADQACVHPHIFQKAPEPELRERSGSPAPHEIILCHRKTCEQPLTDVAAAMQLALKKTRVK